jgi:uncharacterized lipoprotein
MSAFRFSRPLILGVVAIALVSAGGCSWFKSKKGKGAAYTTSVENRPLEVPPDLDAPDTSASTSLPAASLLGGPKTVSTAGFAAKGSANAVWDKVGKILDKTEGVTMTGRAEAITSFDVTYEGQSFLIRVEAAGTGSRVAAISPDGQELKEGPGAKLLAEIERKL